MGRHPKYSDGPHEVGTADDFHKKIEGYFAKCEEEKLPLTITGLAMALGMTRKGLCEYAEDDEFGNAVKKAKATVEESVERRLFEASPTGAIFWLKNNSGWKDKQEIEHSGTIELADKIRAGRERASKR